MPRHGWRGLKEESKVKRSFVKIVVVASIALGAAARAQGVREAQSAPGRSAAALVARLKGEAEKMKTAKLSQLFSALAEPRIRAELRLSAEQIGLSRQLDELTRDIIKAWLIRSLDTDQPPPPAALSERLSQPGDRLRARLIAHAEAIALHGILTPEQARLWCTATGRKPEPLLRGRDGADGPLPMASDERRPAAELADQLRCKTTTRNRAGVVSNVLLGEPGMRAAFPNGIGHLDPIRQRLAIRDMPKVDLGKEQAELAESLDQVTLAIWRFWLTRDLDKVPLPPQPVLAQRLWEGGERIRESLFAHAEAIALEGIVTPDQAERALRAVWELRGMRSLLDPVLASRLRLSRSQREEVLFLLNTKRSIWEETRNMSMPLVSLRVTRPELGEQIEQLGREARNRQEEVDGRICDVLTPSQARMLERLLGADAQPPRRPATKRGRPNRPG